jgi:ureidoacrylate peracid hydrolase
MTDQTQDRATKLAHVLALDSLKRKVDPGHAALIIIDIQNDFCAPSGLVANEGQDVSEAVRVGERLPAFVDMAHAAGVLVIFVRTVYTTQHNFYLSDSLLEHAARRRPGRHIKTPFCVDGSWGGDFFGEVRPRVEDPIVTKHRYSGFYNTELDTVLRVHGIRTLILTGVATNVCVATTAHDGFMRDYYIVLVEDGTASYTLDQHEAALNDIHRYFGEVTNIAAITSIWREQSAKLALRSRSA